MRKKLKLLPLILFIIIIVSPVVSADQIKLQNGNNLRGEVQNDSLLLKTNYAQLNIQSRYLNKINRENGNFIFSAAENNEFSGQLLSEIVFIVNGSQRNFAASEIDNINFSENDSFNDNKKLSLTLANDDFFFASTVEENISVNTSLGSSLILSYDNISSIEYLSGEDIYLIKRNNGSNIKTDLSGQKIIIWPAAAEIIELDFDYIRKITF